MSVPDLDVHTADVVTHLTDGGILTGRGVEPAGAGWQGAPGQSAFAPYAIVWRIGSRDKVSSNLDGLNDQGAPLYHIRVVGGTPQEADELLAQVDARMLDNTLTITGRRVIHVIAEMSLTTTKDPQIEPAIYFTGGYYRIWTLPA